MRHGLWARTEGESRDELGPRLPGDPQPGGFGSPMPFQAQFVELHLGQLQGPHQPLMQALGRLAGAGEPSADGGFRSLEDARSGLSAQAFGQGLQDLGDAGLMCCETVHGGVPARRKLP